MKTKDFALCVDSDGCAMDTMDYKHIEAFGPLAANEWRIKDRKTFLHDWNDINLHTRTRGINRFEALVTALENAKARGEEIEDFSLIKKWTKTSAKLSAVELKGMLENEALPAQEAAELGAALRWSEAVNERIASLSHLAKPFEGVFEALEKAVETMQVAIVSNTNTNALKDEWTAFKLMPFVSAVYGQEAGTKAASIKRLLEAGFKKEKVLMVGDAPGDLKSAQVNGVLFFPILFGKESESWKEFRETALVKVMSGKYAGEYQKAKNEEFFDNFERGGR